MSPKFAPRCGASGLVKIVKNWQVRTDDFLKFKSAKFAAGCGDSEVKRCQNREKLAGSDDFLKFKSAKLAPRCGERAVRKPKPLKVLKPGGVGALFEIQNAFRAAGAGISTQHPYRNR